MMGNVGPFFPRNGGSRVSVNWCHFTVLRRRNLKWNEVFRKDEEGIKVSYLNYSILGCQDSLKDVLLKAVLVLPGSLCYFISSPRILKNTHGSRDKQGPFDTHVTTDLIQLPINREPCHQMYPKNPRLKQSYRSRARAQKGKKKKQTNKFFDLALKKTPTNQTRSVVLHDK